MEILCHNRRYATAKIVIALLATLGACPIVCAAQTTTIFDVLVATETLTVVGTTTFQGNAFSVGSSSFVVAQGKVGIATSAPIGLFTVGNGTITVLNSGFVGIATTAPAALLNVVGASYFGVPTQFQWIGSSGAIRSGIDFNGSWGLGNIGVYSVAFGNDNVSSGDLTPHSVHLEC
jgi:hypothetical protein